MTDQPQEPPKPLSTNQNPSLTDVGPVLNLDSEDEDDYNYGRRRTTTKIKRNKSAEKIIKSKKNLLDQTDQSEPLTDVFLNLLSEYNKL